MDKEMEPASSLHGSKEKLVYSDGRNFLKIQILKASLKQELPLLLPPLPKTDKEPCSIFSGARGQPPDRISKFWD